MNQNRQVGLLVVAAGVGAAFVVMIGTGYHVTHTAGSPIGDGLYLVSIVVLAASVVVTIRNLRPGAASPAARYVNSPRAYPAQLSALDAGGVAASPKPTERRSDEPHR